LKDEVSESLLETLEKMLTGEFRDKGISDADAEHVTQRFVAETSAELLKVLKRNAPEMLNSEREHTRGFEERNYARWKEPLDLLTTLWVCAQEISEGHSSKGPRSSDPLVFDTLAYLQPRALLVASEIQSLLRSGYADAALARWRTLHEIVVTMMFLAKHGQQAALSYRMSLAFADARAAYQYNKYAGRAKLTPISANELAELQAEVNSAKSILGRSLKSDWDWAQCVISKDRITFAEIEADIEMDHWRPRYKWACRHIHSSFSAPNSLLGQSEAAQHIHQVGPSNSGLVDPIQMTAISLVQATVTFILYDSPNLETLVLSRALDQMAEEIGPLAIKTEETTLANRKNNLGD
jgi:hypothetical protein